MVSTDKRKTCRESMEIIADIITTCIERRRKTQLMLQARLNHEQISHYTNHLSHRGLLKQYTQDGIVFYITTEKGRQLLCRHVQITQLICDPFKKDQGF